MKKILATLMFATMAVALSACPNETTQAFIRTEKSPKVFTKKEQVHTYYTTCEDQMVYGPDESCGRGVFSGYERCIDSCHESSDPWCEQSCDTRYPVESCNHVASVCTKHIDQTFNITAQMAFDRKLKAGEKEKIICKIRQNGTKLNFKLQMKSPHYVYDYPKEFSLDLNERTGFRINFKTISKKK